jgi:hypothetical protein
VVELERLIPVPRAPPCRRPVGAAQPGADRDRLRMRSLELGEPIARRHPRGRRSSSSTAIITR